MVIDEVCKSCNSDLGTYVDSGLVNNSLIAMKRHALSLSGKEGEIPNPFGKATLNEESLPNIDVIFDPRKPSEERIFVPTRVEYTDNVDGSKKVEIVLDTCNEQELSKMIEKMSDRWNKKGFELSPAQRSDQSFENPKLTIKKEVQKDAHIRGLLKIAYEVSYKFLGEQYLSEPISQKIRDILRLKEQNVTSEELANYQLRGTSGWGRCELLESISLIDTASHYALFLPDYNCISCTVQIFDSFYATFQVSDNPYQLTSEEARIIQINAQTKVYAVTKMQDFLNQLLVSKRF